MIITSHFMVDISEKNYEEVNKTKFTADEEIMLLPYGDENKEKNNEDTTEDCLTINKLLIHPFSFLKYLYITENIKMKLIIYNFFSYL